jgi:hypothetical protein
VGQELGELDVDLLGFILQSVGIDVELEILGFELEGLTLN